jgi:hypothetical protein
MAQGLRSIWLERGVHLGPHASHRTGGKHLGGYGTGAVLVAMLLSVGVGTTHADAGTSGHSYKAVCNSPTVQSPARQGRFLGIVAPSSQTSQESSACRSAGAMHGGAKSKGYNGSPPLTYHGGPVMGTPSTAGAATVTPIYWDPNSTLDPNYKHVINGFITNVAADSGKLTNVFSTDLQYNINYDMSAGTPIVDTDPFPASGCTPDTGSIYKDNSGYSSCLTDPQVQSEVVSFLATNSLPSDLAHLYIMFLPKGVEACFTSSDGAQHGGCSINHAYPSNTFCGYHASSSSHPPLYSDMPFPIYNSAVGYTCSSEYDPGLESPNAQIDADVELGTVSHEINESITDPEGSAWYDKKFHEVGDECSYIYGSGFGGTSGALYNQTINGANYFIQEEFSNENYRAHKATSCVQHVNLPLALLKSSPKSPKAGNSVKFSAKKSKGTITSYIWNFGDASPTGSGKMVNHTYGSPGSYTVTLTLTDVVGLQHTSSSTSEVLKIN